MFYTAKSQNEVNTVIAPFRVDANIDTVTSMFSSIHKDKWISCLEYANANGVMNLFAKNIRDFGCQSCLPSDLWHHLNHTLEESKHNDTSLYKNTLEIILALEAAGVPYLILKGAAFAHILYSELGTRPTRDLDLLIKPEHLHDASNILKQIGFTAIPDSQEPDHHLPRMIRANGDGTKLVIELHHRIIPRRIYGIQLGEVENLWQRSMWININDVDRFHTLSRYDHVIHMHIHLFHHLFYNFRLMHLVDIVFAFRKWQGLIDWNNIADDLRRIGLTQFRHDLWTWIAIYFGDVLSEETIIEPEHTKYIGDWLLRHGSLPIMTGLRYAKNRQEWLHTLACEVSRYKYRSLWAPGWGVLYLRSKK